MRIQGGENAVPNSWPSVALLIFQYTYFDNSIRIIRGECGATLIQDNRLLTAAHCFKKNVTLPDKSTVNIIPNKYHRDYNSMYKVYLGLHEKSPLDPKNAHNIDSFELVI